MNQFNLWDLWNFSEVEIKRIDGGIHKGRVICVDEGKEEYGDDGIIITIENSIGIRGHMARNIEHIILYEAGQPVYKIVKEDGKWQKTIIT